MTDTSTTIASGTALSPAIDLTYDGNKIRPRLFRVNTPSAWTTAVLSFAVSETLAGMYLPLYKNGVEVTLDVAASQSNLVPFPADFASIQYLKIRSGTVGTPVNQAADRVLTLVTREI